MWEDKLSECQVRGWKAVPSAGSHGKGSPKRRVYFTDTGSVTAIIATGVCEINARCENTRPGIRFETWSPKLRMKHEACADVARTGRASHGEAEEHRNSGVLR